LGRRGDQQIRAALVAVALCAGCATTSSAGSGRAAAEFSLPSLGGGTVSLQAARGKVALIDFWASWCVPCRGELTELEQLARTYRARGVAILTVNLDSDREAAQAMVDQLGLTLPVGLDADKAVASTYQLPTMPTSFVVDRAGVIRYVHEGFFGAADVQKFHAELDELLAAH
jgi:peroxiredoxin